MCLYGCKCLELSKNYNTEVNLTENRRGYQKVNPIQNQREPNEGELANIVSKIPGSSLYEDVNDWLKYDRDDPGHHIMTDDKIVGNLRSEEVTGDDNGDDVDEEEENLPSHNDDFQSIA